MSGNFRKKVSSALRTLRTRSDRAKVSWGDHSRDRRYGSECLMFEQLEPRMVLSTGPLVISEFMAANGSGLRDQDNEFSDWIEIHNPGETAVDLTGWYLTDTADNLREWQFPAMSIDKGGYLVVFASGKNRLNPIQLHTNFKLSANGEYLALVKPDGETISYEYAPSYPQQFTDKSYGMQQEITSLFDSQAPSQYWVPTVADAAADWTSPTFDDTGWNTSASPSTSVLITEAGTGTPDYVEVQNVSDHAIDTSGWYLVVNKGLGAGATVNTFVYSNTCFPPSLAPGEVVYWTDSSTEHYFGQDIPYGTSGKGWAMVMNAQGAVVDYVPWVYSANDVAAMNVTVNGFNVRGFSVWSGPGTPASVNPTSETSVYREGNLDRNTAEDFVFHLPQVGVPPALNRGSQNPGLVLPVIADRLPGMGFNATATSFGGSLQTDVYSSMYNVNSSLWQRVSFNVDDPTAFDSFMLQMKYNDGFVAYLNGAKIVSVNAPASPAWNSVATATRATSDSMTAQQFNVPEARNLLVSGTNVLAIQGLNVSKTSNDFLVLPQLIGVRTLDTPRYFSIPTPWAFNDSEVQSFAEKPTFSVEHGVFTTGFLLALSAADPTAMFRYTLDGSTPTMTNGVDYAAPITIDRTTVVRAFAYNAFTTPGDIGTQTYIFPADVKLQQPNGEVPGPGWPSGSVNGQVINYGMDPNVVDIVKSPLWAPQIENALKAIPTMSIVTDLPNLFDPSSGIYVNANFDGETAERPASLELIYPPGATGAGFPDGADAGFQIDMGLRIRGGYSRGDTNPKHAFRFFFNKDYGGQLNYPLFGAEGASSFAKVDLRTSQNYSWAFGGPDNNTMVREIFSRDLQGAMGQLYSHGRYYHLYIDGVYWGLYQTDERMEANFAASYLGGNPEDYDTMKTVDGYVMGCVDGTGDAYHRLWQATMNGFSTNEAYYRVQGLNPDGTPNPNYERLLDVDNLIDYMIITYYTGDRDGPGGRYTAPRPNNFYAIYNREDPDGFKFLEHDSEHTLGVPGDSNNMVTPLISIDTNHQIEAYFNAHWLHEQLALYNDEYVMRFADRLYKRFFNDGVLTDQASLARINYRAAQIETAIIAESARWGDTKREPPMSKTEWLTDVNEVRQFIAGRANTVISQVRGITFNGKTYNWYPSFNPPTLSKFGGQVAAGYQLTLTPPTGTGVVVYYTLDGSDPRLIGGGISPTALIYHVGTPVTLSQSTLFHTRALKNGEWSALSESQFLIGTPAAAGNLAISEIYFNPTAATAAEMAVYNGYAFNNDDFEFIEVLNTSAGPIDLTGMKFTNGVEFTFGSNGGPLLPGQRAVVVNNLPGFQARYGTEFRGEPIRIAGEYRGSLANTGETLGLTDRLGSPILSFSYDDAGSWPDRADGTGASLVLIDPAAVPSTEPAQTDYLENGNHWRSSVEFGGSPGAAPAARIATIVVNEVLTHTDPPQSDSIELYNPTPDDINISGWYLSDSAGSLMKFRIPDDTILVSGAYRVYDEADFNPSGGVDPVNHPNDFSLDGAHGDDVWLMKAEADKLTEFVDRVSFPAAANGESFGRWPNATGDLYPMTEVTLGEANSGPRVGPVIISELQYHPIGLTDDDREFIEIYNTTALPVDLTNWRIRKGVDFDFAPGTTLPALSTLVVLPFDPNDPLNEAKLTAFREAYSIDGSVPLVGGYAGNLDNAGETVQLQRADDPPADELNFIPHLIEDEVSYDDDPPWPTDADGGGNSLHRLGTDSWGHDVASWQSAAPSPGSVDSGAAVPAAVVGRHVFYNNSAFDNNQPAADADDDRAIAPDKQALLPGGTAAFLNYTSYPLGINGIMVDIADLPTGSLGAADFQFKVGNSNSPADWVAAPAPLSVSVRRGDGVAGSARVTIVWADADAVRNRWLQVTVLATPSTGLQTPDLFYFGNAVGEAGNAAGNAIVNATDEILARNFVHGATDLALVDDPYDYNRDRLVNGTDQIIARNQHTNPLNMLRLIAPPASDALMLQYPEKGANAVIDLTQINADWLYQFQQMSTRSQSAKKSAPALAAIDLLLADGWT